MFLGVSRHSENICCLHIKQHHGHSAENSVSRVSSIQIMQVRVQNKGKSVWKSRYDRDISVRRVKRSDLLQILGGAAIVRFKFNEIGIVQISC